MTPFKSGHAVAALLLAAAAVACTAVAPTPAPSPTPASSPTPTRAPASPAGADLHAFPALEERLPSHVGQYEMVKVSLAAVADEQRPVTLEVLRRLGRTPDDVQLAVATGGQGIQVSAFRIVGAEGVDIVVTFQTVEEEHADSTAVYGVATVAGRRLVTRTAGTQLTYLYPAEDIMFVLAGDVGLVEEALGKLP